MKSLKVILRSSLPLPSFLGSRAYKILIANLESEDNPRPTNGFIISSDSKTPEPSSSQDINKFFANSTCFLLKVLYPPP